MLNPRQHLELVSWLSPDKKTGKQISLATSRLRWEVLTPPYPFRVYGSIGSEDSRPSEAAQLLLLGTLRRIFTPPKPSARLPPARPLEEPNGGSSTGHRQLRDKATSPAPSPARF